MRCTMAEGILNPAARHSTSHGLFSESDDAEVRGFYIAEKAALVHVRRAARFGPDCQVILINSEGGSDSGTPASHYRTPPAP